MNEKPRRRCSFAFRLRTLFVVVAVASIPMAWVGYSLNWIKQRHVAMKNQEALLIVLGSPFEPPTRRDWFAPTAAPDALWLFGEKGVAVYFWVPGAPGIDECRRLFPEAEVVRALPATRDEP